jgi:DNA-binding transcriptional MocR family regulator
MNSLDKCYKTLQKSSRGLRAVDLAKELNLNKSTIHRALNSLQYRGKVEERNGEWCAKQDSPNQSLDAIRMIFGELESLSLKQAEFKARIRFIEDYNPENTDHEPEITELRIKIEELERLRNDLITQLKLSTAISK